MSRLKDMYFEKIVPELSTELGIKNVMAIPQVMKVVVNVGIGQNKINPKFGENAAMTLQTITGQKPTVRKARKAISGFKVRAGDEVGVSVTLRGSKMYDFLDKLASIALPRLRDFRGLNGESFDSKGNLTLGIKEQNIFPEISHEKAEILHGLEVTIVTRNSNKLASKLLLTKLGFPFKESNPSNKLGVKEQNG